MLIISRILTSVAISLLTGVFVAYLLNGTAFYVGLAVVVVGVMLVVSSVFEYIAEKRKNEKTELERRQSYVLLQKIVALLKKEDGK